jgi:PmbA protein
MSELLAIAERVVAMARAGEEVEAVVVRDHETHVRAYEGEVEQLESAETHGVGVRVVLPGGRQGFAYCGTFDDDAVREVIDDARDNAGFATADDAQAIASPDGVPFANLDLWREELMRVSTDEKIKLALELESATRSADRRITGIEAVDYHDGSGESAVATTTGIRAVDRSTSCAAVAEALAADGDASRTGYAVGVGRTIADLDIEAIAAEAAERTTSMLGATKPASTRTTVVLDPHVTASFLGIIAGTLSGDEVIKGRSPFGDRVGDVIAAPSLTLTEDPTNAAAPGASASDGEGIATRRVALLDNGELRGFLHNSYTGRRSGAATTGSAERSFKSTPGVGCSAISLVPGLLTPDEIFAQVGEGIYITAVMGLHSGVNSISGDFSTGAEGRRISGGALAEPLNEFTIGSTLQRMLLDVVAVGSDLRWLYGSAAGLSLAIHDVTISGE